MSILCDIITFIASTSKALFTLHNGISTAMAMKQLNVNNISSDNERKKTSNLYILLVNGPIGAPLFPAKKDQSKGYVKFKIKATL